VVVLFLVIDNSFCPGFPIKQGINAICYFLMSLLCLIAAAKLNQKDYPFLKILSLSSWIATGVKIIIVFVISTMSNLLGKCYLAHGFSSNSWFFGFVEIAYLVIVSVRLGNIHSTLGGNQ